MRGKRFLFATVASFLLTTSVLTLSHAAGERIELAPIAPARQTFAPLPRAELPGERIGWEMRDTRAVFRRAAVDGLPVVVVVDPANGGLFGDALRCPTFNALAGRAHFILIPTPIAEPNSEAGRLAASLQADRPYDSTIVTLASRGGEFAEISRISGYQGEQDVLRDLAAIGLAPASASANALPLSSIAFGELKPRDCEAFPSRRGPGATAAAAPIEFAAAGL
jgi:hypothetical protein